MSLESNFPTALYRYVFAWSIYMYHNTSCHRLTVYAVKDGQQQPNFATVFVHVRLHRHSSQSRSVEEASILHQRAFRLFHRARHRPTRVPFSGRGLPGHNHQPVQLHCRGFPPSSSLTASPWTHRRQAIVPCDHTNHTALQTLAGFV